MGKAKRRILRGMEPSRKLLLSLVEGIAIYIPPACSNLKSWFMDISKDEYHLK
jgi:hypothetical protein